MVRPSRVRCSLRPLLLSGRLSAVSKTVKDVNPSDMSNHQDSQGYRLKRRQFLANLLFAGGALSLAGLQGAQAAEHPADGWTMPDLNKPDPKPSPTPPPQPPILGRRVPPKPPEVPPQPPTAGVPIPVPPPQPRDPGLPCRGNVVPPKANPDGR